MSPTMKAMQHSERRCLRLMASYCGDGCGVDYMICFGNLYFCSGDPRCCPGVSDIRLHIAKLVLDSTSIDAHASVAYPLIEGHLAHAWRVGLREM